jgi:hypothetical protein
MGEAKRRAANSLGHKHPGSRSWAIGTIDVIANGVPCFSWRGTRHEAAALHKRYLDIINALGHRARSYALRAAGYLMAYGMPKKGDVDQRPSNHGGRWAATDIELYRQAILWLALREHIPNTGQKIEDVFAGKSVVVVFEGDKDRVLEYTARELCGEGLDSLEQHCFQMKIGVGDRPPRIDPRDAKAMTEAELFALAGHPLPVGSPIAGKSIYVPRIPIDAAEAMAMLDMMTILGDSTDPASEVRVYAGYTDKELIGDKPAVRIR